MPDSPSNIITCTSPCAAHAHSNDPAITIFIGTNIFIGTGRVEPRYAAVSGPSSLGLWKTGSAALLKKRLPLRCIAWGVAWPAAHADLRRLGRGACSDGVCGCWMRMARPLPDVVPPPRGRHCRTTIPRKYFWESKYTKYYITPSSPASMPYKPIIQGLTAHALAAVSGQRP